MKGDKKIIEILNGLLAGELTAVDQYLIHGEMYADFGLPHLAEKALHESDHERQHARALIQRILRRGMDSGEFRPLDLQYGTYTVLAPMLFLATWKHSFDSLEGSSTPLDPHKYIAAQVETILYGLCNSTPAVPAKGSA